MDIHRIIFASSLKPAFDTRTQKLFSSFEGNEKYDCYFCGVHLLPKVENHKVYSWKYGRGFLFRLAINFKFIFLLFKIKPQTIILNNNDLLFLAVGYKLLFKKRLIYDIRENTVKNIMYQNIYKGVRKRFYLYLTNRSNKSLTKYCSGFILAEKCYEKELLFIKNKPTLILENKAILPVFVREEKALQRPIQLLFSGTISQTSGVCNALNWLGQMNKITPCQLTIVGHTTTVSLHRELLHLSKTRKNINYKGTTSPVGHQQIEKEISIADFGLICYEITKANEDKIPTKLYECLAHKLPIICQEHNEWNQIIEESNAGIIFTDNLKKEELEQSFYQDKDTRFAVWDKQKLTKWFSVVCLKD